MNRDKATDEFPSNDARTKRATGIQRSSSVSHPSKLADEESETDTDSMCVKRYRSVVAIQGEGKLSDERKEEGRRTERRRWLGASPQPVGG
jgi:hypothetical protein